MKISRKTIILTSLITLAPVTITVLTLFWFNLQNNKGSLEHKNLEIARISANYIQNHLEKTEILLTTLETLPAIKNHDAKATDKILQEILPKYPFIWGVYAVDLQGKVFGNTFPVEPKAKTHLQPFFRETLKKGGILISGWEKSLLTGEPIVRITYPIKDQAGKATGILGAPISLEALQRSLASVDTHGKLAVYLVDNQGFLLAGTGDLPRKFQSLKKLRALSPLQKGFQGVSEEFNPYTQQLELIAYVPLPKANWGIIVTQPVSHIYAQMKKDLFFTALLFFLILIPFAMYVFLITKSLQSQQRELQEYNRHLEYLSYTDNLTGLNNNRYFYRQIEVELDRCRRFGLPMALLILDIDDFKFYNDTNGHLKGDQVLKEFSQILRNSVRSIDTVARYGGEEFVVMLVESGLDQALAAAERIRQAIYDYPFESENKQPRGLITASIGVAVYPDHAQEATRLIELADQALYQAKQNKNTIAVASQQPEQMKLEIN